MLISTKTELIENLDTVEGYLSSGSHELYDTMAKYIAHGRVFVSYKVNGAMHFAPSRFVGYRKNTLVKHQNNKEKDGRITTPVISALLGVNQSNSELEDAFIMYCDWLGVTPTLHNRTFWQLNEDITNQLISKPFYEGAYKIKNHLERERNNKVVLEAKRLFKSNHDGKLFCEVCGFNYANMYGTLGEGFIEAHHKVEFSKTDGIHEVIPDDFAMVCSNCHSMLHKGNITISQLKKLIKK